MRMRLEILWLVAFSFACGDSAKTTDMAQSMTMPDLSMSDLAQAGPTGNGVIACGTSSCAIGDGEKCCVTSPDGIYYSGSCAASCGAMTIPFACDGPEDCGGKACCYDEVSGNVTQGCDANKAGTQPCGGGAVNLCHTAADCPSSMANCCIGLVDGVPNFFGTCLPSACP